MSGSDLQQIFTPVQRAHALHKFHVEPHWDLYTEINSTSYFLSDLMYTVTEGIFLNTQGRIQIENGALIISNLNLTDSGTYQCIAENKHGVISSSAELQVVGKIIFPFY